MGSRLFVGNLSYATTEEALRSFFDDGQREIIEVRIIADRETGRSRGFGFVELGKPESARSAIAELDGKELDGRPVQVKEARERGGSGPRRGPGERSGPPREPRGWDRPARGQPAGDGARNGGSPPPRGNRPNRSFEPPPLELEAEGRGGGRAERERRQSRRKKKSYDPEEEDW